ncbi:hypothetical protein ACVWZW_007265 [Bradyrhizobium sp. F1.13.4]
MAEAAAPVAGQLRLGDIECGVHRVLRRKEDAEIAEHKQDERGASETQIEAALRRRQQRQQHRERHHAGCEHEALHRNSAILGEDDVDQEPADQAEMQRRHQRLQRGRIRRGDEQHRDRGQQAPGDIGERHPSADDGGDILVTQVRKRIERHQHEEQGCDCDEAARRPHGVDPRKPIAQDAAERSGLDVGHVSGAAIHGSRLVVKPEGSSQS